MRLHGALFPWEIALSPRETVFSNVTDVSRGKFPVSNIHGYVKKITHEASMTLTVVSCNGVLIPKVQEPITMLRSTTRNCKVSSQLSFASNDKLVRTRINGRIYTRDELSV